MIAQSEKYFMSTTHFECCLFFLKTTWLHGVALHSLSKQQLFCNNKSGFVWLVAPHLTKNKQCGDISTNASYNSKAWLRSDHNLGLFSSHGNWVSSSVYQNLIRVKRGAVCWKARSRPKLDKGSKHTNRAQSQWTEANLSRRAETLSRYQKRLEADFCVKATPVGYAIVGVYTSKLLFVLL